MPLLNQSQANQVNLLSLMINIGADEARYGIRSRTLGFCSGPERAPLSAVSRLDLLPVDGAVGFLGQHVDEIDVPGLFVTGDAGGDEGCQVVGG